MVAFLAIFLVLWLFGAVSTLFREGMFQWVMADFLLCALMAAVFMTIVFFVARRIRRYDLVDAAWGGVFIVVALTSFFRQNDAVLDVDIKLLVTFLVCLWGARLGSHILRRIKHSSEEDPRYVELRKKWKGSVAINTYFKIYMTQALLALFICIPVIHINLFSDMVMTSSSIVGISLWYIGFVMWLIGFWCEKTADDQLRTYLSNPANRGTLMTTGLWKYSRHPNYFGELMQWWGIFVICLATPFGWVGIVGPVLISFLILFVSGIPLSEKRFKGREGWDDYKRRTSALIPLPNRKT